MKKPNRRSKQTKVVDSSSSQSSATVDDKEHYKSRVFELEMENDRLKREIEDLRYKGANFSSTPDASVQKTKEAHLLKMNALEKASELKKKLEVQSDRSTHNSKSEKAAKSIQDEIQRLRAQKVQFQCKLKLESVKFRLCKSSMQKEILQLKKENRRTEYQMHLLSAINQRQKLVMQRKTREAFMATNRLKELLESRKSLACRTAGARNGTCSQLRSIGHELDVTVQVQEVCSQYESEMEEMANVIEKLKLEAEALKDENCRCSSEDNEADFGARDLDLIELREEVTKFSSLVSQMATANAGVTRGKSQASDDQVDLVKSSVGSSTYLPDMDTSEPDLSDGAIAAKTVSGECCSCSKQSLCKTWKCGCRAAGGSCGNSCGCKASKCTNRRPRITEAEKSSVLASQDAMQLRNTLIEKPPEMKSNSVPRQPLKEIGNTKIKSISIKPEQRKQDQKPGSEHSSNVPYSLRRTHY